jgi:hypothetical protein
MLISAVTKKTRPYEATYTLKCLAFEDIAKNRFLAPKLVFHISFKKN